MSDIRRIILSIMLILWIAACAPPAASAPTPSVLPEVRIVRHPGPDPWLAGRSELTSIPKFDPNSTDYIKVDLRSRDLTKIHMTTSLPDLMYATFDSKTKWPDSVPVDFDWKRIMEIGKDPGLGIRALHAQGINGKGIGIAIIDQPLLVDHQEYKGRLRLYEEINVLPDNPATMHGAAVASIAAGKTVGVAPEADLYYIGAWTGDWDMQTHELTTNFEYYAQAVHRILEINEGLPEDRKIHVITMQVGWVSDWKGANEITAAIEEAKAAGIFVISSNLHPTYGLYFQGLGRDPLADPNQFGLYRPGLWWEKDFFAGQPSEQHAGLPPDFYSRESLKNMLLVPMDSRTTASPTGNEDYVFYREGGWSWSIPYLGGMYALAAQVRPEITPEEFWETALQTGRTIQFQHDGKDYEFGVILDPGALIEALKNK